KSLSASVLVCRKSRGLAIDFKKREIHPAGRLLDSFARAGYAVLWHCFLLTAPSRGVMVLSGEARPRVAASPRPERVRQCSGLTSRGARCSVVAFGKGRFRPLRGGGDPPRSRRTPRPRSRRGRPRCGRRA